MTELLTQNSIVVYLEILNSLCDISDEGSLAKIQNLYDDTRNFLIDLKTVIPDPSFVVKIFSNILIITDVIDNDNLGTKSGKQKSSFHSLLYFLSYFQTQAFIKYQWLVRGCLSIGPLHITYNDILSEGKTPNCIDFVWGKALVFAVNGQKNQAIYPRVMIEKQSLNIIQKLGVFDNKEEQFISEDDDGIFYINYLNIMNMMGFDIGKIDRMKLVLSLIRQMIEQFEKEQTGKYQQTLQYLNWTKNYFLWANTIETGLHPKIVPLNREIVTPITKDMDEYFVVYLDMLGSEKLILNDDTNLWLNNIDTLYKESISLGILKNGRDDHLESPIVKIFSDNIVYAIKVPDNDEDKQSCLARIYMFVSFFQSSALLYYKWLLRGGMTVGKLYMNETFVWGPALLRAHQLENELAIYPRVIIDPIFISSYHNHLTPSEYKVKMKMGYPIMEDNDGWAYLGYEDVLLILAGQNHKYESIYNSLEKNLEEIHKKYKNNERVMQKIKWSINYHKGVDERWCEWRSHH